MTFNFNQKFQTALSAIGEEAEAEVAKLHELNNDLQEQVESAKAEYRQSDTALEETRNEVRLVKETLASERETLAKAEKELAETKGALARTESQLKNKEQEVSSLETEKAEFEEKLAKREEFHERRYSEQSRKMGELREELENRPQPVEV